MYYEEINRRLVSIMPKATVGMAKETVIAELKDIKAEWKKLLRELAPQYPACNPDDVRSGLAATMLHLAMLKTTVASSYNY
jgi:hypothetical protein